MDVTFEQGNGENRHRCQVRREGDWAVFTCPLCDSYERKINLVDGQMITHIGHSDPFTLHEGFYVPVGLNQTHSLAN
jgi:hypothetical protein